jgi:hypothetical protein
VVAAAVATVLLTGIGLTFSAALTLTARPERWSDVFLATAHAGAVHGWYFHWDPEALRRFGLMTGMAFGTVGAFLVLDGEWLRREEVYRQTIRRTVPVLYVLGGLIYGLAGLGYAPTVLDRLPRSLWLLAGGSLPLTVLLALAYSRRPGPWTGGAVLAGQALVLGSNAIARQVVQFQELRPWVDLSRVPVRGEWGSFCPLRGDPGPRYWGPPLDRPSRPDCRKINRASASPDPPGGPGDSQSRTASGSQGGTGAGAIYGKVHSATPTPRTRRSGSP